MLEKLSLKLPQHDLATIRSTTAVLLAYLGLRSAFGSFPSLQIGLTVCTVPEGFRTRDYRVAARFLFEKDSQVDWTNPDRGGRVFEIADEASGRHYKDSNDTLTVFHLSDVVIVITSDIEKVPVEVRFAAERIIEIQRPTGRQIRVARRIYGNLNIAESLADDLATMDQAVILAAIAKRSLTRDDMKLLEKPKARSTSGPTLDDLPGYEQIKGWARGVRRDIDRWRSGQLDWSLVSRGALLSGPPGTGKTAFAEAFANFCGFELVAASVGEWQAAGHLDDTLLAMRASFEAAASARGAVLFIDEIDGIGSRKHIRDRHQQYWRVVINEFLALTSRAANGVIIVGASNFPELIDPAILRSGRIEEKFVLELPDARLRAEILAFHLERKIDATDLRDITDELDGYSPADLERLARKAKQRARSSDRMVKLSDVIGVVPERRAFTYEDRFRFAVHEAGHALVAVVTHYCRTAKISLRDTYDPSSDGYVGGMTSYELVDDAVPTEVSLECRITVALAGAAAEEVVFGTRSIGAGGGAGTDLERATTIAARMVASYGLGSTPIFVRPVDEVNAGTLLPVDLEAEVRTVIGEQFARAVVILTAGKERLLGLAREAMSASSVTVSEEDDTPPSEQPAA